MGNIAWFKELSKDDIPLVGGKGANLGEMFNSGIPVPPGFIVTAEAFKNFLDKTGIADEIYSVLDGLDVENNENLQAASKKIGGIIINAGMPNDIAQDIRENYDNLNVDEDVFRTAGKEALDIIKSGREPPFVAVRSSATAEDLPEASFAGQQETFLNIKGAKRLIRAVQDCWASLFTARAIYYRVQNNFPHDKVLIAVVVQKMVNSNKSGVIFSVNPVNNEDNEIVIEAGWGLGEAVVSGSINPDSYIIAKDNLEIKNIKVNEQTWMYTLDPREGHTIKKDVPQPNIHAQILNAGEIRKLAELTVKIEDHYGKPQDIEYAIEGSNIYIVQSRPITTLKKKVKEKEEESSSSSGEVSSSSGAEVILEGTSASPGAASGTVKMVHGSEDLGKVLKGDILVTRMTNPDMVPTMQRAAAIVTDAGGATCHAAIVSREMGIPCIVGTEKATKLLHEGDIITVDATNGKVYKGEISIEYHKEEYETESASIETVTDVKVIMDFPDFAEKAAKTGADGVGLLRNEFMILKHKVHPYHMITSGRREEFLNDLTDDITKIAKAFKGKPVWYRTLDAPTDEFRELEGGEDDPIEDNPMMGWRSIRRSLDQPELLLVEFEAIKRVHDAGFTNVGIMIPLVTHIEQIVKAKEYLRQAGFEPMETIEFGVMIETPASVWIIEEICQEGVDFISFGTNDLTQFTMACDRNSAKVIKWYDEKHPAIKRQIKHVIEVCRKYNVETSICGQAGSDPEMAEFLVKTGIDSITANADAVRKIRHTVAKIEKKLLLNVARKDLKETEGYEEEEEN
ncbi:MAG: phosphoenolpyruvate synthase [Nanoarchaeota archaeon]|nr:phosphoenolpyruvate synthase [Nanoarchaeota archaeon]